MYLGYFVKWLSDAVEAVGEAVKNVLFQITHSVVWGGMTLALLAILAYLFVMNKKAGG